MSSSPLAPIALVHPAPYDRTGAGDIIVTLNVSRAFRFRVVAENSDDSTGNITAVAWKKSAVGDHYGPSESLTVSSPVAPGDSWGASDYGDCVDQLELTVTVDDDATITVSLAGV